MKGILDFIIHIPEPFKEKFTTESGMEFYGDKRFMPQQLSNRKATIINVPCSLETVLQPGFEVLVDPTILYEQNFHLTGGAQESIYLVDKDKAYYKINPRMIIAYRNSNMDSWIGFMDNGLYERIEISENEKKIGQLFLPESSKKKHQQGKAKVVFKNEDLEANIGQTVFVKEDFGIEFFLDGKILLWYRNEDVLAIDECN